MENFQAQTGVIYMRRPRGKKLTFMMGGPTLEQARSFIRWDVAEKSGFVFEWHGADGTVVELKRQMERCGYCNAETDFPCRDSETARKCAR